MRSRSLYNNSFMINPALGYISEPTWRTSPEKRDCFCFCECITLSLYGGDENERHI